MVASNLDNLIDEANHVIGKALDKYGNALSVACSFGKDSMVVLHLAIQQDPNILVVWNNTLIEYPETIKFAKKIVRDWNLNFIEGRPLVTFWDVAKEYNFPTPQNRTCCKFLKLYPATFLNQTLKIRASITGLRKDESRMRANLPLEGKDTQIPNLYRYNPIVNWTEMDVWEYHIEKNLPMNNVYIQGITRTGCLYCTLGASMGALKIIKEKYPRRWEKFKKYLEKDPQFIENKDGTFRITKDFKKVPHTEKHLKNQSQLNMNQRIKDGMVFRVGPNFNRNLRLPYRPFL